MIWVIHDPTTLKTAKEMTRVLNTVRLFSIWTKSRDISQRHLAETSRLAAEETALRPDPIVTEIVETDVYYPAEEDHQNYYRNNPGNAYCSFVVKPKVDKFKAVFRDKVHQL